ncbi:MAG: methyltransferase [Alphaproteobacteria bacterium]|nr:methyltransferase [Alphaproteobacteria bacterium]
MTATSSRPPALAGGRGTFIRANTRLLPVPHAGEISLHVADEATILWHKTEEELATIGLPPPYWAFAWAGGQALARYVLDHPESCAGRTVLDFASGSGLVAIAAALVAARSVAANDIDDFALAAIALNAASNDVHLDIEARDMIALDEGWDVVLAGDVFYERPLAERIEPWLRQLKMRGALVLIGDPGRAYLPRQGLVHLAEYQVPTTRALEDAEVRRTSVWSLA